MLMLTTTHRRGRRAAEPLFDADGEREPGANAGDTRHAAPGAHPGRSAGRERERLSDTPAPELAHLLKGQRKATQLLTLSHMRFLVVQLQRFREIAQRQEPWVQEAENWRHVRLPVCSTPVWINFLKNRNRQSVLWRVYQRVWLVGLSRGTQPEPRQVPVPGRMRLRIMR